MTDAPAVSVEDQDLGTGRAAAFASLATIVREWRGQGRKTTTAGIKSALQRRPEGFDERALGFVTFAAFLEAAEAEGLIHRFRQPNGHWIVMLPGESGEDLSAIAGRTSHPTQLERVADEARLRPDVWASFVDWRADHRRLWDVQERRALMFPVDHEGKPAWLEDPQRFVDIPILDQALQVQWMREFAERQPDGVRSALLSALSNPAATGSFRRALTQFGLQPAWRAELHRRVAAKVSSWAAEHSIPGGQVVLAQEPVAVAPHVRSPEASTSPAIRRTEPVTRPADATDLDRLRQKIHAIVDRMSLAELAALPIRAEHLLAD